MSNYTEGTQRLTADLLRGQVEKNRLGIKPSPAPCVPHADSPLEPEGLGSDVIPWRHT